MSDNKPATITDEMVKDFIKTEIFFKVSEEQVISRWETFKAKAASVSEGGEKGKDWEILTCYNDDKNLVHNYISSGKESCDSYGCKICSVKRLSDGVVFTIGDEIGWGLERDFKTTLLSFRIEEGELEFEYRHPRNPTSSFVSFEKAVFLHKVEAPPKKPESIKPPLGIIPEWLWKEQRYDELEKTILRYAEAKVSVPTEWLIEHFALKNEIQARAAAQSKIKEG